MGCILGIFDLHALNDIDKITPLFENYRMKLAVIFTFFITLSFADSTNIKPFEPMPLREVLLKTLPENFSKINNFEQTKPSDIEKLFGKPNKIENQIYYYNYSGINYDLSFVFKNNKLDFYTLDLSKNNPKLPQHSLKNLSRFFDIKDRNIINDILSDPSKRKSNSLIRLPFKNKNLALFVLNDPNFTVKSIQLEANEP